MDFGLSGAQQDMLLRLRSIAESALSKSAAHDGEEDFRAWWKRAASAGLAGFTIPADHGGQGHGVLDVVLALEAMADCGVDPGHLFSLGVHQLAITGPILALSTPEQADRWLGDMASGRVLGAFATSELGAGSDAFTLSTVAREVEGGFEITGEKLWVTNAPVADLFLVSAKTDEVAGAFGITAFLVAADAPGVAVAPGPAKVGISGAPWGSLVLDKVRVGSGDILGARGGAAMVFQEAMRWERCGLFAIPLGAVTRGLRECVARLSERKQFGAPLIDNPAVARSLALVASQLEAARLLLYKAAASVDAGEADDLAISLAKSFVSEAALSSALELQKLYGAIGVLSESPAARLVADMQPFRVLSGANEVHYQIIARLVRAMAG